MIWERIWDKIALAWFLRRKKLSLQVLDWRSFLGIKTIHGLKCEFIHSFIQKPICTSVVCSWNQKPICSSVVCWQAKMEDLTFCCPVCSKDFSTKRKLKNHSYIHELCATLVDDSFCLLLNWGSCVNHTYNGCFRQTLAHTYTSFCTFHSREKSPTNLWEFRGGLFRSGQVMIIRPPEISNKSCKPPGFFLLRSKSIFDLKKPPWQK